MTEPRKVLSLTKEETELLQSALVAARFQCGGLTSTSCFTLCGETPWDRNGLTSLRSPPVLVP